MRHHSLPLHSRIGNPLLYVACIAMLSLAACDLEESPIIHAPVTSENLRQFVTGQAAQSLDGQGEFALSGPPVSPDAPMISRERAGELALAFVRTWGRFYVKEWTRQHGGTINPQNLQVDPRIFYAETPHGRFPEGYHPAFRRAFGPWYLVRLTSGATPVLMVAVSAYNTDLKIDPAGKLVSPELSGNDFEAMAIARGRHGFRPITPEEAVSHVGQRSGARTKQTPELALLYLNGHPVNAAGAVWKLSVDHPLRVRNAKGTRRADVWEIFVGPGSKLYIPEPEQPSTYVTTAIRYDAQGKRLGPETVRVPVKPGAAVSFEEAVLEEGI